MLRGGNLADVDGHHHEGHPDAEARDHAARHEAPKAGSQGHEGRAYNVKRAAYPHLWGGTGGLRGRGRLGTLSLARKG